MHSPVAGSKIVEYKIWSERDPRWNTTGSCTVYGDETPPDVLNHLDILCRLLGEMPDDLHTFWWPK